MSSQQDEVRDLDGIIESAMTAFTRLVVAQAVEACANQVKAVGCICWEFIGLAGFTGFNGSVVRDPDTGYRSITTHEPRCPIRLAEELREKLGGEAE